MRSCSKLLSYADDRFLEVTRVAFVVRVRRLEDSEVPFEGICAACVGSGHPRKWQRSGPPRLANRARFVGVAVIRAADIAVRGCASFRRSSSRKARGVSQTFDRLSQNFGGKLETLPTTELDLILFAGRLPCIESYVLGLFRFCMLNTGSFSEMGEGKDI